MPHMVDKSRCVPVIGCVLLATITIMLETLLAESVVNPAQRDAVINSYQGIGLVLSVAITSLPKTRFVEDARLQIQTPILSSRA
jgi:hypothetical protein